MGRKAGGKDFSPRVRALFDIAIKELLASGKLLPKLKEQLLNDPAGTMQRMAQYAPKQVDMKIDQAVTLDTTAMADNVLEEIFNRRRDEQEHSKHIH